MYSEVSSEDKKSLKEHRLFRKKTKRLLTKTENDLSLFFHIFMIYALMFVFFGICSVIGSSLSNGFLKIVLSLLFLGYGILHFYFYRRRGMQPFYKSSIFFGLVGCLFGLIGFFISSLNYQSLLVLYGVYFFIVVLERGYQGFPFVRVRDKDAIVFGVILLLLIFMAILLFINPFFNLYFGEILGVFSILFGVLNLSSLSFLQKKEEIVLSFYD
ncbi:MAG: hypothetical protein HFI09_04020 [Bacilli bacterium]|nr:hypothetical protein [Bacilli bacterium]